MRAPILIMAGGTGGHVYPALAVAQALRARSVEVVWLGTQRGPEAALAQQAGFRFERLTVFGVRGKALSAWLLAPFRVARAFIQAVRVLRRHRPAVVLGMGGFVSAPGGLAAWMLRRPLAIHEQNAIAGSANKLLARVADRVLEAFPGSFGAHVSAHHVGNPVRGEILALAVPAARFAERSGAPRLLVLGGSQGALALNRAVPEAIAALAPQSRPEIWHQAGERTLAAARSAYERHALHVRLEPFIEDIAAAYGWADLVLCRAGAMTVSELAAAGLGAVLVPFPFAIDDHQTHNARKLVDAGAARLLPEAELDTARLSATLGELLGDRPQLLEMAVRARACAAPGATRAIRDLCLELAGGAR